MKHEFDKHIKNYRENLNETLSLSGETSDFFARYKTEKLFEWFTEYNKESCNILDFGCGDGNMTQHIHNVFPKAQIFGADPSSESITQAQKTNPEIIFKTIFNSTLDFPPKMFDLIYAAGVFHHIPFQDHKKTLSEIMRILKPNGRFVLFELNPLNPLTRHIFKNCPIDKNATMLSSSYAKKLLKPFGKTDTKFYCFFPAQLSKLRTLEKYITKLPFGALYATIIQKI